MRIFARVALAALLLGLAPARAQQVNPAEPDPAAWLRQIYALYQRAQNNPALDAEATDALVEPRASRALAALFKKNHDCEKKSEGICALDWDFVIDGQDFKLSNVKVGALAAAGDKGTVTVSFVNLGVACVNVYMFVREDGVWKLDEIETRPKGETTTRIAQLLRDFKE